MRLVGFKDINEQYKNLAQQCVGICEANSFEKLCLWKDHSPQHRGAEHPVESWEDLRSGGGFQLGEIDGRPVSVEFTFVKINGKWVMFYSPMSIVADYDMIQQWLEDDMSHAYQTDAMNFFNIIHHINRLRVAEATPVANVSPKDLGELADEHPVGRG